MAVMKRSKAFNQLEMWRSSDPVHRGEVVNVECKPDLFNVQVVLIEIFFGLPQPQNQMRRRSKSVLPCASGHGIGAGTFVEGRMVQSQVV